MNRVLAATPLPDDSLLLQVSASPPADLAPGHCYRLEIDGRHRVLPVLDASVPEGWLAFRIAAAEATGTRLQRGVTCALHGPLGVPVAAPDGDRRLVLLADAAGLPAVLFATRLGLPVSLALAGLDDGPAPVRLRPSRFMLTGFDGAAIAGIAALEDAGIPSRLSHPEPLPGCATGDLATLVTQWLDGCSARVRWERSIALLGGPVTLETVTPLLRGRVGHYSVHPAVPTGD